MLWFKAWRESRARFVLSAGVIAGLCLVLLLFQAELRRRAAALLSEKRRLVAEGITDALGEEAVKGVHVDALSTLILSVLDGLSVASYIEGDSAKTEEAYRLFLYLLRLGVAQLDAGVAAPAANG